MATDDDDAATLRERVRELEQTVAQQQDTIQQLMPSRRAILAGGAGLVGGAALTGQASAQSAAGQVGTSSEPVDVEAASVNVQEDVSTPSAFVSGTLTASDVNTDSVNTEKVTIGAHETVEGVEIRSVQISGPSAASDDGWDTESSVNPTISFNSTFESEPEVVVTPDGSGNSGRPARFVNWGVRSVTTSDFDLDVLNKSTTDLSATNIGFTFCAIETS